VLAALLGLKAAMWLADQHRYALSDIAETDSLSGDEFEDWLSMLFETLGFGVGRTPYRRDYGADLIATWNGMRTAVQAKSGHTNVVVAAVQQIVAAKAIYGCERADGRNEPVLHAAGSTSCRGEWCRDAQSGRSGESAHICDECRLERAAHGFTLPAKGGQSPLRPNSPQVGHD
jgi:hypothetical protein